MPTVFRKHLVWALALAALAAGCDGRSGGADGAAPEPTDATSVGTCDPARQDCPGGQTCDLVCNGGTSRIMCRPLPAGGGTAVGGTCRLTEECGPASGCFATASTGSACVRYCDTDAACGAGTTCQVRSVVRNCPATGHFMVKFCLPPPAGS
jgi:hypothetical protein